MIIQELIFTDLHLHIYRNKSNIYVVDKDYPAFQNKPWFLRVYSTSLLKSLWGKEKLLVTSKFSLSHSVFCPTGDLSAFFIKLKIVVCKLFQFG